MGPVAPVVLMKMRALSFYVSAPGAITFDLWGSNYYWVHLRVRAISMPSMDPIPLIVAEK